MPRFVTLARYTNQGISGLIDNESDRKAVMKVMHESVGATLVDYCLTRGQYDFFVISDADSFEQVAAMTLRAKASGTVQDPVILETLDIQDIRDTVKRVKFPPPEE